MKCANRKEKYFFRFVDFQKKLLPILEEVLPGIKLEKKQIRTRNKFVIAFELTQNFKTNKLQAFIKDNRINSAKYGVWVSLVTERDIDGVHVPDFVIRLIARTGGQLDFSFTLV